MNECIVNANACRWFGECVGLGVDLLSAYLHRSSQCAFVFLLQSFCDSFCVHSMKFSSAMMILMTIGYTSAACCIATPLHSPDCCPMPHGRALPGSLSRCASIVTGEDSALPRCKPFKYTYEKEIVIYPSTITTPSPIHCPRSPVRGWLLFDR